jgi:hypothetical protein
MKKLALAAFLLAALLSSCTQQERAKGWSGTATIDLPKGQKLVNVTWKETQLWYLTRPMNSLDSVETYTFKESSSFGIMEGEVVIKETK